jgi:hypothetical protein
MVRQRVGAGALAGLVGGLLSAVLLQLMRMTTAAGARQSAMRLVGESVHARGDAAAWVAYVVYAAVIGGVFGWLLARQDVEEGTGLAWGGLYGAFWWLASSLVVIPLAHAVAPLTPAAIDLVRGGAAAWLVAMVVDGVVTGGIFAVLAARRPPAASGVVVERPRRAA